MYILIHPANIQKKRVSLRNKSIFEKYKVNVKNVTYF